MVKKANGGFEEKLAKLEEIVGKLEDENTPIEESLTLFEEGVTISRELSVKLEEVKRKIEVLKKDAEGKLKLEQFEDEDREKYPGAAFGRRRRFARGGSSPADPPPDFP